MRNLKKFLAMTLTVLMVVGSFSFASFAQKFDDVYDYADAIDVLSDLGVIWGYEDGTFGPDNTVERWHMALWIAKMETGKVTTDDYLTIWRAEENYTDFTDVIVDQAIGAINYAADEGIIIGTSPTTFAPTAGITYQDALTMVVRALGFGGKAMDAGYPWKYINKAAELGLEEGLSGIAYKDVLTRAETAQILYNALNTVDADGKTYIADVFGLTTVVITGTTNYRIIETESVAKKDYVSFNVLNADGTLNDDVTYHLPAAAFGIEPAKADKYVGASFKVTTDDNFKTLGTVIENPSEVFDAAKITGEGTPAAPNGAYVTLGEDKYDAVKKYSSLYNAQGIKGNIPEIIVYVTNIAQESADGYFKVDSNYNILDADGKIVAYYRPDITGSYLNPYAKKLQNDVFYMFPANADGQKDAIKAAGGVWYSTKFAEYKLTENTYDLVKNNKYATAKAYDDNGDGVYDRLFYTYHEFGKIYANTDTPDIGDDYYIETGLARPSLVVKKFIDGATGEALAAAPSGYIRYSYDPLSKYLTVYENYTFGTGLVTTVNKPAAKIVIGGTQYSVGIATYPGAAYDNTGVLSSLVGKQVNYILADGVVIRVFDSAVATNYIVFDNLTGLTSAGYATALAYVQSNQASVITIATINGYSYQNYALLAQQGSLSNITGTLKTGMLFTGTKDALGFWHLTEVEDYTYLAFEPERNFKFWKNRTQGKDYRDPDAEIFFRNGIANTEDRFYYDGKNYGTLKSFAQFNTNANTLYIVYNESKDRFYTAKGIPVNDAKILVDEAVFVDVYDDASTNGPTARFVYVYDGTLEGQYLTNAWQAFEYDTVIYVDRNSVKEPVVTNDLGSTGTLLGSTWQYNRVLDMINGKWITVQTAYNFQLKPETFYTVSNGYVEAEVDLNDGVINEGLLKDYGIFYSIIEPLNGPYDVEYSAYTYLYELDADGNVVFDPNNGNLINKNKEMATDKLVYVPVYYYVGDARGSRVILYINGAKTIQDAFPKAAEKGNIGVAENKDATIKVDYFYIPYKYTPKSYNYADNFTALKANEKSPVNYFLIPQALYEALSDHNRLHRHEWNENINISTYDDWMRIYDKDGKEVENWAADFTMLIDNVTVGSNVVKAPVYAMGIQQSPNHAYKPLDAGIYTIRFKYNNEIYVVYVQLQLEDVPTLLADAKVYLYNVDKDGDAFIEAPVEPTEPTAPVEPTIEKPTAPKAYDDYPQFGEVPQVPGKNAALNKWKNYLYDAKIHNDTTLMPALKIANTFLELVEQYIADLEAYEAEWAAYDQAQAQYQTDKNNYDQYELPAYIAALAQYESDIENQAEKFESTRYYFRDLEPNEKYKVTVWAVTDKTHSDSLHGGTTWHGAMFEKLIARDFDVLSDDLGEAIFDIDDEQFNIDRSFKCAWCAANNKTKYINMDFGEDYYYVVEVKLYSNGEVVNLIPTIQPSIAVKVVDKGTEATITVKPAEYLVYTTQPNTYFKTYNVKYNGWGGNENGGAVTYFVTGLGASGAVQASKGYTWTIKPDPTKYDSSDIFGQFRFEHDFNFDLDWWGSWYHSFPGSRTEGPEFMRRYVLPFELPR